MSSIGAPAEWVDLIDTLVPEILDLVIATWRDVPALAPDAHEDEISEHLCRSLQKAPRRANLPFQIRPQIIELEPAADLDQGRMDIAFLLLVPREDVYFCLECKRLNVPTNGSVRAYSSEYVRFGMLRFVEGKYAPAVRQGGMLGYVLNADVERAITNVASAIKAHHVVLGTPPPGDLLPSSLRPGDRTARETVHDRPHSDSPICIHHIFLA